MGETQYDKLKKRIHEIIENFSFTVNVLEPPTEKEEDMVRAMIVLCHAEFEDYLENLAQNLLTAGEEQWVTEQVANRNIAALFLNSEKMKNDEKLPNMTLCTFSRKMINQHRDWINYENHGIKRKNIENMYMPLGYNINDFNQDFLNVLDAFGVNRGKVAHLTFMKTRNVLDFTTERDKILYILAEIETFEQGLNG